MRFGLIHRVMTDSLAALGLLALVTSGELNHWVAAAILAICVFALGPHGPGDGVAFRAARKLVPGMSLLRQPLR